MTAKKQGKQAAQPENWSHEAILESISVPFDDIVKVNIFLKNLSDLEAVDEGMKIIQPVKPAGQP